jgi:hypothetical protein
MDANKHKCKIEAKKLRRLEDKILKPPSFWIACQNGSAGRFSYFLLPLSSFLNGDIIPARSMIDGTGSSLLH